MGIPVSAAKEIAEKFDCDQVIIVGRKVGEGGREHVATYGKSKAHCDVAAKCGDFLKFKVMGWHRESTQNNVEGAESQQTTGPAQNG
jgi:hypothetical protein